MPLPVVGDVYAAASLAGVSRNTQLLITTTENWTPKFREGVLNQTPFFQAMSLAAFGRTKVIEGDPSYGNVAQGKSPKTSGNAIVFKRGGFQFGGPILSAVPSGVVVGRMGNINPQYNETGTSFAYPYRRFVWSIYIPEEEVQDNVGDEKLMDLLQIQLKLAQGAAVRDVNYTMLGNSSAPTNAPKGLNSLNGLITVGATANVGQILAVSGGFWDNQRRSQLSVGGGGELDRPLALLRAMDSLWIDIATKSQSREQKLLAGTRGAYQYYKRAAYADTTAQGTIASPGLRSKQFYDANIDHLIFNGAPFIYDSDMPTAAGADTNSESISYIDLSELGMAIKPQEYFRVEEWEPPRAHDKQRFYQTNIWLRWTPFVSHRRVQGLLYNLPNNADAD